MLFKCAYCNVVKFTTKKYLTHLELSHQHQANFVVGCAQDQCQKQFRTVHALRRHLYRCHPAVIKNDCSATPVEDTVTDDEDEEPVSPDSEEDLAADDRNISLNSLLTGLETHLASFVLKVQEHHVLPKVVQQTIIHDVKFLLTFFAENFRDVIRYHLQEKNICIEGDDFQALMSDEHLMDCAFQNILTDRRFFNYCRDNIGLVEPVEICLGTVNNTKQSFQYVPILDVLKFILQKRDILDLILNYHHTVSSQGHISDYKDGNLYRSHPLFGQACPSLQIFLYVDEFEVVNPLGSKKGVHKLTAVYFTLGNLPPKYRSQLKFIYLCILVRHKFIQGRFTYADILKPLITDLNKLSREGIVVENDGQCIQFKGGVAAVSADNLSANSLAGFQCSFSCGRICRFCMTLFQDVPSVCSEEETIVRTKETHSYHLQAIQENSSISTTTYGVAGKCALSDLDYFNVITCFPPDIMHDVLEGVIPLLLKLLLLTFHSQNIVSIQTFNAELEHFEFGRNDKAAKPIKTSLASLQSGVLRGKAIERWCLFRLLPFLIGEYIDEDNQCWKLYLKCREIVDIIFAPSVNKQGLYHLRLMIQEFLENFCLLFPGKCTPKFHYMVHYPRLIADFGPLRCLWCMRFEAKHQYFKKVASVVCNFKNIAGTLASRHQMKQCYDYSSFDHHPQNATSNGGRNVPLRSLCKETKDAILSVCGIDSDECPTEEAWKVQNLTIDNVQYSMKDFFVIDLLHEEEIPIFVKISTILKFRSQWVLCGKVYVPKFFNSHLHAYCVESTDVWQAFHPGEEYDYHPLDSYSHNDESYITLHHHVCLKP